MRIEGSDYHLNDTELMALVGQLGLTRAPLSPLFPCPVGPTTPTELRSQLAALAAPWRTALEEAVRMLAVPTKVVKLHYTSADLLVARAVLGLSTRRSEDAAVMMGLSTDKRIQLQPLGVLQRIVLNSLVVPTASAKGEYTLALPTQAAVIFLALCEAHQAAHLRSVLQHTQPWDQFVPADILGRLQEADREDFRWPLMFFSKVMPVPTATKLTLDDVKAALPVLTAKGLIEPLPDMDDVSAFKLTEDGWFIAECLRQQVGKVALGVTTLNADGTPGCVQLLLVRGATHLIMCALNGEQAIMGIVLPEQVVELVAQALMPARVPVLPQARRNITQAGSPRAPLDPTRIKPTRRPDVKVPKPRTAVKTAGKLAAPVAVRPQPPKPVSTPRPLTTPVTPTVTPKPAGHFCVTCGASLRPGARFCTGCGKPVV